MNSASSRGGEGQGPGEALGWTLDAPSGLISWVSAGRLSRRRVGISRAAWSPAFVSLLVNDLEAAGTAETKLNGVVSFVAEHLSKSSTANFSGTGARPVRVCSFVAGRRCWGSTAATACTRCEATKECLRSETAVRVLGEATGSSDFRGRVTGARKQSTRLDAASQAGAKRVRSREHGAI